MGRYDDATKPRKAAPPPAEPSAPPVAPHACAAHGCPVWGSVTLDGTRLCFVHALVANRRRVWDQVTGRIRNRMDLVEAVRLLRSGGNPSTPDERVLQQAVQAVPHLAGDAEITGRYRALLRVERMLIEDCIQPDDPLFHDEARVQSARNEIAALADRFTRRPEPVNAGGEDGSWVD